MFFLQSPDDAIAFREYYRQPIRTAGVLVRFRGFSAAKRLLASPITEGEGTRFNVFLDFAKCPFLNNHPALNPPWQYRKHTAGIRLCFRRLHDYIHPTLATGFARVAGAL
jgi:hypothetical protein